MPEGDSPRRSLEVIAARAGRAAAPPEPAARA